MKLLPWIAVPLMLVGAAMLLAEIGEAGLWIVVIGVGIALVAIHRGKPGSAARS